MGSVNNFLHKIDKQRALVESYKTDESGNAWPSVEAYIEKLKSKGIPLLDNVSVLVNVNGTVQEMTNKGQTDIHSFIPEGTDDTNGSIDPEAANEIHSAMERANQTIHLDVELSLNGYIDATTHEFVESNDYVCSGYVYVKGVKYIDYKTRSIGDSYHICFYDKYKNSIPSLDFPVLNSGIQGTINLESNSLYDNVYYIILSAYTGGYPPFLRLRGEYDITKTILENNLDYKEGYNLFNLSGIMRGKRISPTTGLIQENQSSICSNIMLLPEDRGRNGDLFLFNLPETTSSKRFAYYDDEMNIVESIHEINASDTSAQINCPSGAKYFCFTLYHDVDPLPNESAVNLAFKNTVVTFQYSMTNFQDYYRHIRKINNLGICASSVGGLYAGKKWVVVGDSLTERNQRTTKLYHDFIKEWLGFNVINMGVSGTGYKSREDAVEPTTSGAFYQRVQSIPADADLVTIFGSFNDLTHGYTLGTPNDTGTTTICGCINKTIEEIYSINPSMKLGIIAPCPWKESNQSNESAVAYVEALHDICMKNSIPFLNLFYESGLRPWVREVRDAVYNLDSETNGDYDGVHPNAIGHEMIASKMKVFIQSLI